MSRSIPVSALPDKVKALIAERVPRPPTARQNRVAAELRKAQIAFKRDVFFAMLKRAKLPLPEYEVRFHETRDWRFDYAWRTELVALEVEGGIYSGGSHTRGKRFETDIEKYNTATLLGWRLFRTTPEHLTSRSTEKLLKQALR